MTGVLSRRAAGGGASTGWLSEAELLSSAAEAVSLAEAELLSLWEEELSSDEEGAGSDWDWERLSAGLWAGTAGAPQEVKQSSTARQKAAILFSFEGSFLHILVSSGACRPIYGTGCVPLAYTVFYYPVITKDRLTNTFFELYNTKRTCFYVTFILIKHYTSKRSK